MPPKSQTQLGGQYPAVLTHLVIGFPVELSVVNVNYRSHSVHYCIDEFAFQKQFTQYCILHARQVYTLAFPIVSYTN